MIFHFSIVKVYFVFCSLNTIVLFPFLIKYSNIMSIIMLYLDYVEIIPSVSSNDFYYSLIRDQSRDVTHHMGVSVILQ